MKDEFQISIDPNDVNVVEGEMGNDDGGVRFESFDELVGEREFGEEVLQVETHHHHQQFLQLQVNQKFWLPFHQKITSMWVFFEINDSFTIINSLNQQI
jgi:hypothetical protein